MPHCKENQTRCQETFTRAVNLIVSFFTIAYVWGGGLLTAPHYIFVASLETVGCLAIAWVAWRWREADEVAPARDLATA